MPEHRVEYGGEEYKKISLPEEIGRESEVRQLYEKVLTGNYSYSDMVNLHRELFSEGIKVPLSEEDRVALGVGDAKAVYFNGMDVFVDGERVEDPFERKFFRDHCFGVDPLIILGGETLPINKAEEKIKSIAGSDVKFRIRTRSGQRPVIEFQQSIPKRIREKIEKELGEFYRIEYPVSKKTKLAACGCAALLLGGASGLFAYAKTGHDKEINQLRKGAEKVPGIKSIVPPLLKFLGMGDKDGDGVLDCNDKWPEIYNYPAQRYAREKGLPEHIVEKLAPLNIHEGKPKLTKDAKEFIDNLAYAFEKGLPEGIVYKLASLNLDETELTNKEMKEFIDSLAQVPNKEKAVVFGFLSDKKLSRDELEQIKKCAERYQKLLTHAEEYRKICSHFGDFEDVYVLSAKHLNPGDPPRPTVHEKTYFVEQRGIPIKNLYLLRGDDGVTFENIKKAIRSIAEKSDENDLVFVFLGAHGYKGYICIRENETSTDYYLPYEKLDKELDKIKCKMMVVYIDACFSGSAIPYLKEDNRVIVTTASKDRMGGGSLNLLGRVPPPPPNKPVPWDPNQVGVYPSEMDKNCDGFVSLKEVFEYWKPRLNKQDPQLYNPDLAEKIYMGVATIDE